MDKHQVKVLLLKYEQGICTEYEKAQLESWYVRQEIPSVFELSETELDTELNRIWKSLEEEHKVIPIQPLWPKIAVAASILFFLTVGIYFYLNQFSVSENKTELVENIKDIQPGSNKAILIDASGNQEDLHEEVFVVAEHDANLIENGKVSYNTVLTPKGGQYQVILSDGTHVWLNAASSLKYPVSFSGKERKVEISGEAYFEVAHNSAKPFKVVSDNQVVEVLGTHFNVNTYLDEPAVKTTLLEGSVKVSSLLENNTSGLILKPGEQAIHTVQHIIKTQTDTEQVIAWKNGFFQFENASLESVMRQIARWYDLDVEYNGKISKRVFNGKVYRNMSLSKVLSVLSFSKVNYKVDNKRLIIMP